MFAAVGGWIGWGVDNLIDGETIYSRRPAAGREERRDVASSFADLAPLLRTGQRVAVTDAAGTQVTGTLTDLSAASLSVQLPAGRATFAEAQVQRIERIGDPLWNGALIGLGAGVAGGLVSVAASDCPDLLCGLVAGPSMALGGALGLTGGLLVDRALQRRMVVFSRGEVRGLQPGHSPWTWSVAPIAGRARQGFSVTVHF